MPQNSEISGPYRKPRADVYTVLLVIALLAILLAIVALYAEMTVYNFELRGGPPVTLAPRPQLAPVAQTLVAPRVAGPWRETGCFA